MNILFLHGWQSTPGGLKPTYLTDHVSRGWMEASWIGRCSWGQQTENQHGLEEAVMKHPLVRHREQTEPLECPFGHVQRIVTGGDGGVANVHVVKVTKGTTHVHTGYDEVYYVLSGAGTITLDQATHPLRPGSVAIIPAGVPHSLNADHGEELEFIIFGTPPMAIDDDRAKPKKADIPARQDGEST